MPVLSYLGFDIGITEDGPKLMEINSHSGVHYLQMLPRSWRTDGSAPSRGSASALSKPWTMPPATGIGASRVNGPLLAS